MATQDGFRLYGKVAAVTGATSGSGRAVARRFVAEGARVVLMARGKERLDAEVEALGPMASGIAVDVGNADSVSEAFGQIDHRFGRLDILVNNAGLYRPCPVSELTGFDIDRQVGTNYLGPVYTCRAAIPLLRAAGGGDIVNTSSEATLDPFPLLSMYVSSKAALEAFTRVLALELHNEDIRVTLVIQGVALDGEGSTDWRWTDEEFELAQRVWTEGGYWARVTGRPGSTRQTVEDIADVHVYAITRPRGQQLDTIHVRAH